MYPNPNCPGSSAFLLILLLPVMMRMHRALARSSACAVSLPNPEGRITLKSDSPTSSTHYTTIDAAPTCDRVVRLMWPNCVKHIINCFN